MSASIEINEQGTVRVVEVGLLGPPGSKGETGDLTPELIAARDQAVAAATAADQDATAAAQFADEAAASATAANASKTAAQAASTSASNMAAEASASATAAHAAKTDAQAALAVASDKASEAGASATAAASSATAADADRVASEASAVAAAAAKDAAVQAKTDAQGARSGAEAARDAAITARDAASASAAQAAQSASDAAVDLSEVTTTANNALNVANGIDAKAQQALDASGAATSAASNAATAAAAAMQKDGSTAFTANVAQNAAAPTAAGHLTRKDYVDTADGLAMKKAQNLGDVADKAAARANLAVPGLAETNTYTADQSIQKAATDADFAVAGPAGKNRTLTLRTLGSARWRLAADASAETGNNAGSNFYLSRYNDAGAFIDNVMGVGRSDGVVGFYKRVNVHGGILGVTANIPVATQTAEIGGAFSDWTGGLNPALQVDCPSANTAAYMGIRWTRWGDRHLAAISAWGNNGGTPDIAFSVFPGFRLFVFDGAGKAYATSFNPTSDGRLKVNREVIGEALTKVCGLTGMTYQRIDIPNDNGQRYASVIAQDLQEVLPEGVSEKDGLLHVDPMSVVALLVNAVKELKQQVDALSAPSQ